MLEKTLMNMAKHMWALSIYKRKLTSIALIVSHLFVIRVSILWVGFKKKLKLGYEFVFCKVTY
jgi:hypothetical protein